MKTLTGIFKIIVIGAVISFTMTACDNGLNSNKDGGTVEPSNTSVKEILLNETITKQVSASLAKLYSAYYAHDLKCILVTYKVETIENMFLEYLSKVVIAQPNLKEFGFTEKLRYSETTQIKNINSLTVNFNATVWGAGVGSGAFAGASASASVFSLLGAFSPEAKAQAFAGAGAGATAGKLGFDIKSVTTNEYTRIYEQSYEVEHSLKYDMSQCPPGKEYAVAAFADVGIYQVLKYDLQTKTATAIPGKSLWFNVESTPKLGMYEYSKEEELSIPQQLEPFKVINIVVNEADLYMGLKKENNLSINGKDITDIGYFDKSTTETFKPDLLIPILQQFDYTKLRINVSFDYRRQLVSLVSIALRLRIINDNNTELGRKDFNTAINWEQGNFLLDIPINKMNSDAGEFMIEWSRVEKGVAYSQLSVGNRTITITALK
ncbi:MAG: hypothetical protein LBH20_05745 [Treponema sp.]|jgi:hypothetical protein|nr:hypothetical protein [Treponema sp.]